MDNVNQVLKSFGSEKLLPKSIDGSTFKLNMPRFVNLQYNLNGNKVDIVQTKAPELVVPDGVNVDDIYNSMIEMPLIPENIQRQLKSIKDWKNTLYVPVMESNMEEVDINGSKGFVHFYSNPEGNMSRSSIVWYDNGVIRTIQGQMTKDEVIKLARSLKVERQ